MPLNMQLTAQLVQILPMQTGTGKNGEWKKQEIIVQTGGSYPKKICISIWGDKINPQQLKPGNELRIDFDIESREYNSRWYTDVRARSVEVVGGGGSSSAEESFNAPPPRSESQYGAKAEPGPLEMDDLPF